MAKDHIREDIDAVPGQISDAIDKAKEIRDAVNKHKAAQTGAQAKTASAAHAAAPTTASSAGAASGGASAASGTATASSGSAAAAGAGGAGATAAASSSGAAGAGGAAAGAGPVGMAAAAGAGAVKSVSGLMSGSGSAAVRSYQGPSGATPTASADTSGAAATMGTAGAAIGAMLFAKAAAMIAMVAGMLLNILLPIALPLILIASIIFGATYHEEVTPPALANEVRAMSPEELEDHDSLTNSDLYSLYYDKYAAVLSEIIEASYEAARASASALVRSGDYDGELSEAHFVDIENDSKRVNAAKIISAYSVYAGENASLSAFKADVQKRKDSLITFTTEEVTSSQELPSSEVPDQTETTVLVYENTGGTPTATPKTYYIVPGTTHQSTDGEEAYTEFQEVTVKVAVTAPDGTITGYTEATYCEPLGQKTLYECGTRTITGLAVTMNPVNEDVLYSLWPVDLNAIAQDRTITNAELIELYETQILSYGRQLVGSLPAISPVGDEAFDALAAEINRFIDAQNTHGVTYVYGGDNPYRQMDCSSFVSRVFYNSGVGRSALWPSGNGYHRHDCRSIYKACQTYGTVFSDRASLMPGDIVFLTNTQGENYRGLATHVMIYIGNDTTVEMKSDGIVVMSLSTRTNASDWNHYFYAYGRLPSN